MSDLRPGVLPTASDITCDRCNAPIPANHRAWPLTAFDPETKHFRPMRVCYSCLRQDEPEEAPVYRPAPRSAFRSADLRRRGEKVNTAKLNAAKVQMIRALRAEGLTQVAIAKKFGVTQYAIWAVLSGHRWAHVPQSGPVLA